MFIKDYISKDYPVFHKTASIEEANEVAKEFGFSHIFIKKKGIYLGALSQAFLEDSPEGNLDSLKIHYERFAILEDGNLLDSIRLFHTFDANIIPIINKEEKYVGYLSSDDIFNEFSKYPLFSETGTLLIVQTNNKSYSFTEVARIIETNNAKLYGCFISAVLEDAYQITMKISCDNLSSIDETFERYGYSVVHKYYNDERDELMKDRFGFFQKYLQI